MHVRKLPLSIAAGAIMVAGVAAMFPHNNLVRNISASLDVGWYVRVPFANPEPGSIVMFPIPERALRLAEEGKLRLDVPLMKRVESITPNGGLVVKGDCGGAQSFDSQHYGAITRGEVTGIYVPLPWTMTPCKTLVREVEEEGREAYRKEKSYQPDKAGFPQDLGRIGQTAFEHKHLPVPQALPATCGISLQPCGSLKNA